MGMGISSRVILGILAFFSTVSVSSAAVLDFESAGSAGDAVPTLIGDGVAVTFTNFYLAAAGDNSVGFGGAGGFNGVSNPAGFSGMSITIGNNRAGQYETGNSTATIQFSQAISDLSFWLADIDAANGQVVAKDEHGFVLQTLVIDQGAAGAGDAKATFFSFGGLSGIRSVAIDDVDPIGLDTLSFLEESPSVATVPAPAALPLFVSGFALFGGGALRRRLRGI